MELTYHWEGDYLIPGVSLDDGSSYNICKYGRMRQKFARLGYSFWSDLSSATEYVFERKIEKFLKIKDAR